VNGLVRRRRVAAPVAVSIIALLWMTGCGDDDDGVAAAERRVAEAEDELSEAQAAFVEAGEEFCAASEDYIDAVDRYGGVFSDDAATVGDVKTLGEDLVEPREAVQANAEVVVDARDEVAEAEQELADAQAALAVAQSSTTATTTTTPDTTTTAPLVPVATVDRVERAEAELATATEGITDQTPLTQATAELNAAAFALEVAWLRLFADAGCLTDEQHQQAVTAVVEYTTAVQTALQAAGYYDAAIDGVYGPATVSAVEQLQADNGLPVTGFVDRATAAALDTAVRQAGGEAATQALTHTAAVQSTLKLAGHWSGPVDGIWTPELTQALQAFQTSLGVPATGVVDAATLSALEDAIAEAQAAATSTSTTSTTTSTTTP
jgi:murein L,D-transpeptidase YcbB/YkuD